MSERRLAGLRVLVTRARPQAAALAEAIEREGGRAIVHPVIAIVPPADTAALDEAAANLSRYDWVLLTSSNAADALFDRVPAGQAPRAVAAVGASTARACEARGFPVDLVPETFNADALLQALRDRLGEQAGRLRYLMPRAEEGRETLPQGLRALGAQVDVVCAYRTVPDTTDRDALVGLVRRGEIDVLTFASPSAATFYHRLLDGERCPLPAVCIGAVTAARAEALGLHVAAVPERADVEAVVEALVGLTDR